MAARSVYSSSVSSLPPPSPKSPPEYPDLYGKRREIANIQTLEREIGFLEDELKSLQSLQPVSICCKESIDAYVRVQFFGVVVCRSVVSSLVPLCPAVETSHAVDCVVFYHYLQSHVPTVAVAANANAAVSALFQNVHRNNGLHNRCTTDSARTILLDPLPIGLVGILP
ncbi:hypothetical protein Csa_007447 [Cucumis sativus]|nr:hypothetical protein Csa_007447 [Cucumis sativus]